MKAKSLILGMMFSILFAPAAWCDTIIPFTTTGTTSGGNVSGTALFDIGVSNMTLTLTNTSTVTSIAQVLDGFSFTLTGGSGITLTGVAATGFEDCTSGTCVLVASFVNKTNKNYAGCASGAICGSPYTWTYSAPLLAAGAGSYKPGGIVNSGVTGVSGIPNLQHNDYLVGPVTFTFGFTTAPTDVTSATFLWGTAGEPTGVPDGGMTVMLLGGALIGLEALRRKVRA